MLVTAGVGAEDLFALHCFFLRPLILPNRMVELARRQPGVFGPQNSARLPDKALAEFWLDVAHSQRSAAYRVTIRSAFNGVRISAQDEQIVK